MRVFHPKRSRLTQTRVDSTHVDCLECRFKGAWESDPAGQAAELRIVKLENYFAFKKEASVIVSPSSLITCEQADVEVSMDIDVREQFEE